jgi:dolichol-phosphate mannosyltransferase
VEKAGCVRSILIMLGLSIIIPVKVPEPYFPDLCMEIQQVMSGLVSYEILAQTEEGLTNAVIAGVEKAKYDKILVMDADGQHNPYYIPLMLGGLTQADLVLGVRVEDDRPQYRQWISKIYNRLSQTLLQGITVSDPMTGFILGKKQVFRSLQPSMGYKFLLQILQHNPPPRVAEIPIQFHERKAGKSKATIMTAFRDFQQILSYSWRQGMLRQFFQFAVVGGIGTVINLAVQAGLVEGLGVHYLVAALCGVFAGLVNNFFLNYYWTFGRKV